MMHGFIRNENNFQNYNEYKYKARRTKYYSTNTKHAEQNITYGARRGFRNKHTIYWSGRNLTYSRRMILLCHSRTDPNETDQYNVHHWRPLLLPGLALSMPDLRTSSSTFFNHATYSWSRRLMHVSIHSWKWQKWVFVSWNACFHKQETKQNC